MKKAFIFIALFLSLLFIGCALTPPKVTPNMSVNEFINANGRPDRRTYQGGYEILLYIKFVPPGTMEYWFKDNGYVREQYVPNKRPSEYQ